MAAQRQTISKAFHDFSLLWMRHSTAKGFPSINMLCALAVTRRDLPRKLSTEELSKSWERTIRALQDDKRNLHLVGQDDAGGAPLCDDDFANAVHYFSLLTKEMAEKVMDAVLSIFECGAGDPEELTHSNVQNHSERTGDECESKMNVAVSSISVNCASSSADVVVVVPDHHPSEVVPFALAEADSLQDAENEVAKPTRRTLRPKQRAKGKAKANPKRGQIGYRRNPNRGMDPRSPSQIQITV